MVFRCGARRRSPLNSSNIVLASALVGGKARSELDASFCAFLAENRTHRRGADYRTFQDVTAFQNERLVSARSPVKADCHSDDVLANKSSLNVSAVSVRDAIRKPSDPTLSV
jgi:hypothetical protein